MRCVDGEVLPIASDRLSVAALGEVLATGLDIFASREDGCRSIPVRAITACKRALIQITS